MAIEQADYQGNVNIGLYGIVTETVRLFAPGFKKHDFFGESHEVRLGETPLVGLFAAGNSNRIIVPDIVAEHEQEQLDAAGVDYHVLESRYTAFGNLLLCNDTGCVVSPHLDAHTGEISEVLGVPAETGTVAGLEIPGSCGVATNNGVLLHRGASEEELAHVEEVLDVDGDIGSVNFGTPYVHSGVLADTERVLVGNDTTGPEVQRVQDALGLL